MHNCIRIEITFFFLFFFCLFKFASIATRLFEYLLRSCTGMAIFRWNCVSRQRAKFPGHQMHITDGIEYETMSGQRVCNGLRCTKEFERKSIFAHKQWKSLRQKSSRREKYPLQWYRTVNRDIQHNETVELKKVTVVLYIFLFYKWISS